jgi:hypothetical protein
MFTQRHKDTEKKKIRIAEPVPSSLRPLTFTNPWVEERWNRPTSNLCART